MALPLHVATDGEPIPATAGIALEGPDMRSAMPIADMINDLRQHDGDIVGYVADWREHMASVGANMSAMFEEDGDLHLMVGSSVDLQVRHRSRWIYFLCGDLDAEDGRRKWLLSVLIEEGCYADNRPVNPKATTIAIRDYLRTEGRIMIDPRGKLKDGGGVPNWWLVGNKKQIAERTRALQAYHHARRRWRSESQIKRAVRMLGTPTDNGWIVPEARA